MAVLSVTLLGSPAVALDDAPVRGFVSSKAAALVYYLAATGRAHTREALAGLLWPETPDAQALKNLRDVLSNLRRLLGPALEADRDRLALAAGATVDSRQFEAAVAGEGADAQLRAAAGLYRGPFLDGFTPGALPFEEWARAERERLQQLMCGALQRLAAAAADRGAYHDGVDFAGRLLAIDPTREEAHRLLMLVLARGGQRGAALAQYATCRRVLADELGLDPDEATEALYRQILDGELGGAGAPGAGQAPAPPARPVHAVPASLTALVGRAAEAARLLALLHDPVARLVTVTGTGGVGKTTLALHVAQGLVPASQRGERFPNGVAFVGLAALSSPADGSPAVLALGLAGRAADALGFPLAGPEPPDEQLAAYLREKDLLLILDNCEHLPVADFVAQLLARAPRLCVLATSRARLGVGGEQVLELEGLAFPPGAVARGRLERYEAVQLFRRTALAVSPRLPWSEEVAEQVARICRLVGGLPLAIDLAAGLTRLMPVAEIAAEIATSLEALHSVRRDVPERHRSLRAVFEHSWRLLNQDERQALRRLAVFRGGFGREAASNVAEAALPVLAALIDHSLVRQVGAPGAAAGRYDLPDLVRQFAAERLAEAGADEGATRARHGRHYLAALAAQAGALRGARQQESARAIAREADNLRAAWAWACAAGEAELLGRAADGLFFFVEMRSWFREGVELFGQAAARLEALCASEPAPEAMVAWGKLLARRGWCAFQIGRPGEAREQLERSLALLRAAGAGAELVVPLNYGAACAYYAGEYGRAEVLAGEALAAAQVWGDRYGASVALTVFGQIATLVGRYDDARRYSEQSLAIERELGNSWGMVFPLISLGRVARATGDYQTAQRCFQEGLAIRQTFGDARGVALCLGYLGDTAAAQGDHPEAAWCYREALALFRDIANLAGAVSALVRLSDAALAMGDEGAARAALGEALGAARGAGSLPHTLEALSGLALALARPEGPRARELAALVRGHPAATQESRDRAARALREAGAPVGDDAPPPADLDTIVEQALAELAGPRRSLDVPSTPAP